MQHNPARRYGENVYACRGFEPTGQQVVRTWYDEIKDYNFEQAQFSPQTGHFTAVIWSGTRLLGVGCARSIESGRIFVVANYDPSGNVIGHFEQNVLRPSGNQQCLAKKPAVSVSEMGEQCLRAHNAYRSLHGVPALRLNDDLSAYAQKHANVGVYTYLNQTSGFNCSHYLFFSYSPLKTACNTIQMIVTVRTFSRAGDLSRPAIRL